MKPTIHPRCVSRNLYLSPQTIFLTENQAASCLEDLSVTCIGTTVLTLKFNKFVGEKSLECTILYRISNALNLLLFFVKVCV